MESGKGRGAEASDRSSLVKGDYENVDVKYRVGTSEEIAEGQF